jgi:hypothetical protein
MKDIMEIISLTNWHLFILSSNSVEVNSNLSLNCVGSCMRYIRASKNLYLNLFSLFEISKLLFIFVSFTHNICQYIYTIYILFIDIFRSFNSNLFYPASLCHNNQNLRTVKYSMYIAQLKDHYIHGAGCVLYVSICIYLYSNQWKEYYVSIFYNLKFSNILY